MKVPLYMMSAGDLGLDSSKVDSSLSRLPGVGKTLTAASGKSQSFPLEKKILTNVLVARDPQHHHLLGI